MSSTDLIDHIPYRGVPLTPRGREFAEVFALTMIRSYDRADRVNKAMEARGFNGKYVAVTSIPGIGFGEYFTMLVAVTMAIYLIWFVKLPF
jgi:cobalt/nickel transport system permease protein